ncbi:MAG TPA: hypothetical protein VGB08_00215 [Allosphingosinicella sp.]|jgi:hypothetical protein
MDWMALAAAAAAVVLILAIKRWYASRPHRFRASDGRRYVWHPGYSFTDEDGRAVEGEEAVAALSADWDELHARTARQTAAIHGGRFMGRD